MLQDYTLGGLCRGCARLRLRITGISNLIRNLNCYTCCLYLLLSLLASVSLQAQPSGFTNVQIGGTWDAAVGLTFSKDGNRIYVWEKAGKVWIVENGQSFQHRLSTSVKKSAIGWIMDC